MLIPVAFTFDRRILIGAGVAVKSLIDHAAPETEYDIYILHPDLTAKHMRDFRRLTAGTHHRISFIQVSPGRFAGAPKSRHSWTEIVYYRMLIPELLPQHDKVIYSDVDVFINSDLTELYSVDLTDCEFAAVRAERNKAPTVGHRYFPENPNEFIYWSGLMVFNSGLMRRERTFERFMGVIEKFAPRLKFFDLDAINLCCRRIRAVPFGYVTLEGFIRGEDFRKEREYEFLRKIYSDDELAAAVERPAIIHYAGRFGKPWRRKVLPDYYRKCIEELPPGLRHLTFRDWRKRLFSRF